MFIFIFSYFEVLNNAGIKITTLIILTTLMGLWMLLAYPTITISAQENMTNTDQNMTALGSGTISGANRGTS
jgi:hypothetical protein